MTDALSKKAVTRLLEEGVIIQEDYNIYLYGVGQLLTMVVDVTTIAVLGLVFGKLLQTILFAAAFMFIRTNAGGYHASARLRCYLLTILTIIGTLSAMTLLNLPIYILFCVLCTSGTIILILAPMETENKPLDEIEHVYYRKKTMLVWGMETAAAVICMVLGRKIVMESIVYAQAVLSMALICGKMVQKKNMKI